MGPPFPNQCCRGRLHTASLPWLAGPPSSRLYREEPGARRVMPEMPPLSWAELLGQR